MGVRTLFMSVSLRGFAKLASGVALLGGCNAILGIGSDYDVVPPKGGQAGSCSGNSCASGSSGAGGGTASGGKGGRGGKGGASGGGDATTGAGADAGGQGPVAGMDSSGGVPNAGTDAGGSPPEGGTAGDGNSGGGPNRDTVGVLGEPCAAPGDFGCEGHAQDQRLVCGDEKIWGHRSPCGPGTVCDTREDEAGACTPVVEECDGQAAGFSFCRNRQRFECGVDLITLALRQTCDYVCSGGACTGECTPEATDCGGGDDPESSLVPRTCQADGTWLDAAPCTSLCKAGGCVAATCGDNVQNGDETDRDCGGSCGRTCGVGKGCGKDGDCVLPVSGKCTDDHCAVPACTDGVKNGHETGKDCGGPCATKCPAGQGCETDDDCDASACVNEACTGVCSPGDKKCSGNGVRVCNGSGEWSEPVECTDQTCVGGGCQGVCSPQQTSCVGSVPQTCDAAGGWKSGDVTAGLCGAACTPATKQCTSTTQQQTCNAAGAWDPAVKCTNQTCVGTGVGSSCQGVCAPGQTQCSGSGAQQDCTPSGTWGAANNCPAPTTCQGTACACPPATPNACNASCTDFQTDKFNCGSCGHSCQGGTCSAGSCQPFAVTLAGVNPVNIALSSTTLYYSDGSSGGHVYQVPLSGGMPTNAATLGGDCGVTGLAVDATTIYGIARTGTCSALGAGKVMSAPSAGGAVTTVVSTGAALPPQPWRCLAVDGTNVYFTNYDIQNVYRVAKGGGGSLVNMTAPFSSTAPTGVAVFGSFVYWGPGVQQEPIAGGSIVPLASGGNGQFLAVDSAFVYYVNSGALMKVSSSGGTPVTLAGSGASGPLAIDDGNVYYLGSSSVLYVAKTGGTPVTLASGQTSTKDIAVDASGVYWIAGGTVMKRVR